MTVPTDLVSTIEQGFVQRNELNPEHCPTPIREAVDLALQGLNQGQWRVAEKREGQWQIQTWLKQAILLFFRITPNTLIETNHCQFYDKVPLKYYAKTLLDYQTQGVRIVPPAYARYGAFIASNTILMPSYVNIGAYIDTGTLIDTWATVGSCAQIGKSVHISGGVGIGGVLEPLQAKPTIIEDHCFIGARSEIVEGVIVEEGSVISMGVYIGQSTRIYNRLTGEISYGRVPAGSVVVSGTLPSDDGCYSLYAAIIVKQVDKQTREKVSLNELLRA
jgi:2,3,4,5-tetrahydropyridine-2,6-dicarboxylate N-succinyltransferase